jgi:hypothetical protein
MFPVVDGVVARQMHSPTIQKAFLPFGQPWCNILKANEKFLAIIGKVNKYVVLSPCQETACLVLIFFI